MSRGASFQKHFLTFVGLVCAALFMATTLVLAIGMIPTLTANLVDKSIQKSKVLCVGMMNMAGCMPFMLELWMGPAPNSLDHALGIMMQPKAIIIIYFIAAAGYAIEAAVTGMVSTVMQQRGSARLRAIEGELKELVDRWNDFVDGSSPLDDFGFPIGSDD